MAADRIQQFSLCDCITSVSALQGWSLSDSTANVEKLYATNVIWPTASIVVPSVRISKRHRSRYNITLQWSLSSSVTLSFFRLA